MHKDLVERKAYQTRYHREVWYPKNKARRVALNRASIKKKAIFVSELKVKRGCTDCGYNKHPEALDFDHLRDKEAYINKMVRNNCSIKKILGEIEKCEVVCANCHRIRTATRRLA